MQVALLTSAFAMGLAGGPHCVAMCGAACAGVVRLAHVGPDGVAVRTVKIAEGRLLAAPLILHLGRIAGYAAAGAAAAAAAGGLTFASAQVAALRPAWALMHAFVLAWGVVLMVAGRQPGWSRSVGGWLTGRLRPLAGSVSGLLATGALWVAMPCGLLYSALLLASMANGPAHGALAMALFGAGSAVSLLAAPWAWQRLRWRIDALRQSWGTRLAGLLLAALALQALGVDWQHQVAIWCS